jgi:cobalt-precorrin 5A hydrolase
MQVAVLAITRHGVALAGRIVAALPGARLFAPEKFRSEAEAAAPDAARCYTGKVGDQMPAWFAAVDAIVAIVSLGAVVRLIAPHLGSKESDPAVIVIDEAARFVIPVLSGHLGGANALAGHSGRRARRDAGIDHRFRRSSDAGRRPLGPRTRLGVRSDACRTGPLQCRGGQ